MFSNGLVQEIVESGAVRSGMGPDQKVRGSNHSTSCLSPCPSNRTDAVDGIRRGEWAPWSNLKMYSAMLLFVQYCSTLYSLRSACSHFYLVYLLSFPHS
ncbi:hypothetical protein AVEN_73519-1 [Araneus ventricosus]|uniref:Uncharacterized protein n=1 Tax=Araneus ventricosus TaxID=182803 RepID=A0A4Y2W4P8_ARAVE|nr:hypothetical protein AVEN_73519-1 [Araneus ventricosus]